MTFEEMRALMRRRVVPENLVVQNIVEYLMDDSAQLPQLNAFSFLNRLQQLGMASADFVVLLEGCGAPQPLIDKIKANPAMNLNSLVLTFESAGLTHEDYSRMLYTARLVWEQTQTSGGTVIPYPAPKAEKTPAELFDDDYEQAENSDDWGDLDSFGDTEILDSAKASENPRTARGVLPREEQTPEAEPIEEAVPKETAADKAIPEKTPIEESVFDEAATDEREDSAAVGEEQSFEKETKPESAAENSSNFEDTSTLIVSINPEQLRMGIGQTAESGSAMVESDDNVDSDEAAAGNAAADDVSDAEEDDVEQRFDGFDAAEEYTDERPDEDNEAEAFDAEDDDDEDDEEYKNYRRLKASGYNKPALVVSAIGALVLFMISAYFTFVLKLSGAVESIAYAKNTEEIFLEVLKSYNEKNVGGENAQKYFGGDRLFGTTLIAPLSENAFGMLSDGSLVYTAYSDKITAHESLDVNRGSSSDILPPDNTRFVDVWESGASVIAVFSGTEPWRECGFMRIEKGEVVFIVRQDGALCDFAVEEGEIRLGSVYVPHYTKSFMAADVEEYLPRLGKNGKSVMAAENIVLGNSSGCSFAVWGNYSLDSGDNLSAYAAIGDPVYSGAYGVCAMNYTDKNGGTYGRIIRLVPEVSEEEERSGRIAFAKTIAVSAAADSKDAFAALAGERVIIFNTELSEEGELEGLAQLPGEMKFSGGMLLFNGEEGIFRVADCTDIRTPSDVETNKASGVVYENTAAVFGMNTDGVPSVRLLKLENGTAAQIAEYLITLSESETETVEFGGANTAALSGESCAFSYRYFDGVSVVSVCAVFGEGSHESSLFDDRTGYNAIFRHNNRIIAVSSKGAEIVFE